MAKILLCHVEDIWRGTLAEILRTAGHEVFVADGPDGVPRIRDARYDLILAAIRMPAVLGVELIAMARQHSPQTPVIAIVDNAEIFDAVKTRHAGARILIIPFDGKTLMEAVATALQPGSQSQDRGDPRDWRDRNAPWLLGADPAILLVLDALSQVADTRRTVLITGESGTGKGLAARSLHTGSARSSNPFVAVNCATIRDGLLESDLFGNARTAPTAASTTRSGKFRQADGGTIFLDDIGGLALPVQARVLRLIEDGGLYTLSEKTPREIDVRIVAATSCNLEHEIEAGRFRRDLYCRLNAIQIEMPSLRERPSDIPQLSEYFLTRANARHHLQVSSFDPQTTELMKSYWWPGNIRELEELVERMVIARSSGVLLPSDLPASVRTLRPKPDGGEPVEQPHAHGTD